MTYREIYREVVRRFGSLSGRVRRKIVESWLVFVYERPSRAKGRRVRLGTQNPAGFGPYEFDSRPGYCFLFTVISVPIQAVRVGFFVNDRVSVEPKVGLNVFHTEGETFSSYDVETGVLYHFSKNPIGRGVYLRPYAGFQGISGGGDSETRGIFGAGFGAKIPFADRFATRMEIGYQHMTAPTNGNSDNALIVLFGLSIFSH